ncbi:YbjN domain-containing protein [Roseibacillus ishigakijimensis]|uniref:YbjN domain-containing protein n=1 Tax=Roseibacillus ishigakijimensis TaxID=454146 RepID=A0A934VII6_9BACT|nr:YbjN domain-containing protein [Roseibacillus ishigakijimensis]MBK1835113.1 YbjN domain-containing protein [Roseibacillus ishigakijimensis]
MPAPSIQFQSVVEAFGQNGWQHEVIEGREVLQTQFEAHHTRVHLLAQSFTNINALAIVGETPLRPEDTHLAAFLELVMRANKQLTLGGFEYDFDRQLLVFRITNIFEKEKYDADIIASMVHATIAELDRLVPLANVLLRTKTDVLPDLSIEMLLLREDLLPPIPGDDGEWEGEEEEL